MKKFKLHEYQKKCLNYAIDKKKVGLFLDMGLGKTAITLSIIEKIKSFESDTKVLVVAPKRVAETT